jgi:hypothetical protein
MSEELKKNESSLGRKAIAVLLVLFYYERKILLNI